MSLIWTLLIGLIAGALARFITPGKVGGGFIISMVLGVVGALVFTFIGRFLGFYSEGESAGFIGAFLGSVIILVVHRLLTK